MTQHGFRGLFCLMVAVFSAALADPVVESFSNSGFFGRATFTDHSTLDVIPALVLAAILAAVYVFLHVRPLVEACSPVFARWVVASLRGASTPSLLPLLPATIALELGALYVMETLEQIVVSGHPLGPAVWLGAPVAAAIVFHAVACLLVTLGLSRILDALTTAAVRIAMYAGTIALHDAAPRAIVVDRSGERVTIARTNPLASRSGKRAPPPLFA